MAANEQPPRAVVEQVSVRVLPDGRLTRREAARFLGLQPKTLAMWAMEYKGPRSHRVGGRCFYYIDDLEAFVGGGDAGRD